MRRAFIVAISCLAALTAAYAQDTPAGASSNTPSSAKLPFTQGPVVISEVLGQPVNDTAALANANDWNVITASLEWIEVANKGSNEVDVSGWTVVRADKSVDQGWQVPAGLKVPAGGVMIILCPRNKNLLPNIPASSNVPVAQGVRVGSNGVALYRADKSLAASTGRLPENMPGVTVGLPQPAPAADNAQYTYLEKPTPFSITNAGPKAGAGPFIRSVKYTPEGQVTPGSPISVTAKVRRNQVPIADVTLLVRINFTPEEQIPMAASGDADNEGEVTYTATIPGDKVAAGTMVRWRVQATDSASGKTLEPNGLTPGEPEYEGAVVPVAAAEAAGAEVKIPVLYWFTENPAAATTVQGFPGSLSFNGVFYDNVKGARRGVTSLSWANPKLKFDVPNGFTMRPDIPEMNVLKLNSYFYEVGERSFMKEALAYQVMADEGVMAPLNQYVQVYQNGQFYGLYGMIEDVDTNMLERMDLPTNGPLFKSESGELSNLRWDLPDQQMPYYYSRPNRKQFTWEFGLLANFTKGLAGGGPGSRTSYVFDALNLPAVINENAVQTLLLNQDRCTKNFLVYYNPDSKEWSRVAWDVETSFAQDNGLGGAPGPYYCILACEQWNSPLYCDSEHPQDIAGIQTAWGTITAVGMNPFQGPAVASSGRRLLQANGTSVLLAEGTKPLTFPRADDWDNPDRVQYGTKSGIGAASTFNHLTDAILDVAATRAMYMRRLRTLADKYYGQDKLRQLVDSTWNRIKGFAAPDNTIWKAGDGTRGYTQIATEFIPIRSKQLLQTYAPGGANPLLPGPQDNSQVQLGIDKVEIASPREQSYLALAVRSPAGQAVDVSGWKVAAGGTTWSFPQGTVIPPGLKLHLSPNVAAFRARASSPKAGESVFVIQAPDRLLPSDGGSINWSIVDENGSAVQLS